MKKERRETIFDRKIHLEDLVLDVPKISRLCDQTEGLNKQKIDIGDCELYIEQEGEGTDIVLVHGGPGISHHYFHPHFSRAKEFANVIYYDQRGCGLSDVKEGLGYSVEQAVDDLENLRKTLNIDKWIVLGHSYGGLLAQSYATTYPENLNGLVLVCSMPAVSKLLKPSRQFDFISDQEKEKIKEIEESENLSIVQNVYNKFLNGDWKRQFYYKPSLEQIAHIALCECNYDKNFADRISDEIKEIDLTGAFNSCPISTLILESRWDLTWNSDKIELVYANHPKAKLKVFEHSSHCPFEDEPENFFRELYNFVRNLRDVSVIEVDTYKGYIDDWGCDQKKIRKINRMINEARSQDNQEAYQKLAENYSKDWLQKLANPVFLCYVGLALYVSGEYDKSLSVFEKMEEKSNKDCPLPYGTSLIFQAHMLDLLGRRDEAINIYKKVRDMDLGVFATVSQFDNLELSSEYAARRIKEPFRRIEIKK
ncbi:alpha/beta fold hydrolase [Candidatus Woesearchaeota archaeon]|nr:alpha/beta fold hydrolase [Candidatus Woesearchaeota archaeon]